MKLKNKQFLQEHKQILTTAYNKLYYYSMTPNDLKQYTIIYEDEYKKPWLYSLNCSPCVLDLLKKMYILMLNNPIIGDEIEDNENTVKIKKKRGRPKKK